ncbi:MAG: ATP-binding protein, partial [Mycobacteriales bacterium]
RAPLARKVCFVGSVKWLNTAFDHHDLAELTRNACVVPGFSPTTGLVIVSARGVRRGVHSDRVEVVWGPKEVVDAWRT